MRHYNEVTLQHRFNQQRYGELQLKCTGIFVSDCKYENIDLINNIMVSFN